jgi:formyl-CoA transferase
MRPFSTISGHDEIPDDPQMAATHVFEDVDHFRFGRFRTVDSPFTIDASSKVSPGPAPELGEHTKTILKEMGYSEEDIQGYVVRGVVS